MYRDYLGWLAEEEGEQKKLGFERMSWGWAKGSKAFKERILADLDEEKVDKVVEAEAREMLGWKGVSRQVAFFSGTPQGFKGALGGGVRVGATLEESAGLLEETREAMAVLDARGHEVRAALGAVLELEGALRSARAGRPFTGRQAQGVGDTLGAWARLVGELAGPRLREGLARAGLSMTDADEAAVRALAAEASRCLRDGAVADGAHPDLAGVREERRANLQELRAVVAAAAREMQRVGAAERGQPVIRQGRLCVPIRAGRQGDLGRGAVVLATSGSGSTLFTEPPEAVPFNNSEQELASWEEQVEEEVLSRLTAGVAAAEGAVRAALAQVAHVDAAFARARHARWMGASDVDLAPCGAGAPPRVRLGPCRHPLLLEAALPPLPAAPPALLMDFESDFMGPVGGPGGALGAFEEERRRAAEGEGGAGGAGGAGGEGGAGGAGEDPRLPRALDLDVPEAGGGEATRVVAITGPNTGGKTATLMTLGLACLMAKAGMWVPSAPAPGARPSVPWFDRVLADVGDAQSLEQSLSTFSAHIRRCSRILGEATRGSLVLLDEVGSGTDPTEGAALASALLLRLRGAAGLTVATTHHAETKALAEAEPGFVRASVEFDAATLRPTYRLRWGAAGASNALDIAQALGFDPAVVREAREVARARREGREGAGPGGGGAGALLSGARLASDLAALEAEASGARAAVRGLRERVARAEEEAAAREGEAAAAREEVRAAAADASREAAWALDAVAAGEMTEAEGLEFLEGLEAQVRGRVAEATPGWLAAAGAAAAAEGAWRPQVGLRVLVRSMGGAEGIVEGLSGGVATVRVGALTTTAPAASLEPWDPSSARAPGRPAAPAPNARVASATKDAINRFKWRPKAGGRRAAGPRGGDGGEERARGPAIATSRNTLDVRGLTAEEAAAEAERAVGRAAPGAVLFVVHGVGTGRVRDAVLRALGGDKRVEDVTPEENSNGGCSVVRVRR